MSFYSIDLIILMFLNILMYFSIYWLPLNSRAHYFRALLLLFQLSNLGCSFLLLFMCSSFIQFYFYIILAHAYLHHARWEVECKNRDTDFYFGSNIVLKTTGVQLTPYLNK